MIERLGSHNIPLRSDIPWGTAARPPILHTACHDNEILKANLGSEV